MKTVKGAIDEAEQARRYLAQAESRIGDLQQAATRFFDARPYVMDASADELAAHEDVYRFRLVRRIPFRLQLNAYRALRSLHRVAHLLRDGGEKHIYFRKLTRLPVRWGRPVLVPGVHAGVVLGMDGRFFSKAATIGAPVWNRKKKEVTVVREDPHQDFQGRITVRFHLEFSGDASLAGQSAVVILGAALREATMELENLGLHSPKALPQKAERHVDQPNTERKTQ